MQFQDQFETSETRVIPPPWGVDESAQESDVFFPLLSGYYSISATKEDYFMFNCVVLLEKTDNWICKTPKFAYN